MDLRVVKVARIAATVAVSGVAGVFAARGQYFIAGAVFVLALVVAAAWIAIEDRVEQRGRR